jgi:hypothetical protein
LLDVSDLALSRIASAGSVEVAAIAVGSAGFTSAAGGRVCEVHDCSKALDAGQREGGSNGTCEGVRVCASLTNTAVDASSAVAGETVVVSVATASHAGRITFDDIASDKGISHLSGQT